MQHWLGWDDQLLLNHKSEWTFKKILGNYNTSSVAISADGQYIAVGSGNNTSDDGVDVFIIIKEIYYGNTKFLIIGIWVRNTL